MAYTPLNINVYSAAFAGAVAGLGVPSGAFIIDPTGADYAAPVNVAAFYAQAVDTTWGAAVVANGYDVAAITELSNNIFARGPGYPLTGAVLTQANWIIVATAVVALVQRGDTNASATQNITLPGVSGSNRAWGNGGATTSNTTPAACIVVAVKLIAKGSGLFRVWCNLSWAALAATHVGTVTINVFSDLVAGVPLTLGNVASIGFGSNGVAQPGNVAVNNNGPFASNNAAGITLAGANAGYLANTKAITEGTAAVGAAIAWEGIVGLAAPVAGAETPIVVGRTCLVVVSLAETVANTATGDISIGMVEL